jgi:hypothetical protein
VKLRMPLLVIAAGLLLTTGYAAAEDAQQQKLKACNAEAIQRNLQGDARQAFMSTCLSGGNGVLAPTNPQQEMMKACNQDATAKGLEGADREAFMKMCLSPGK